MVKECSEPRLYFDDPDVIYLEFIFTKILSRAEKFYMIKQLFGEPAVNKVSSKCQGRNFFPRSALRK